MANLRPVSFRIMSSYLVTAFLPIHVPFRWTLRMLLVSLLANNDAPTMSNVCQVTEVKSASLGCGVLEVELLVKLHMHLHFK